jgi:hypothetical protein
MIDALIGVEVLRLFYQRHPGPPIPLYINHDCFYTTLDYIEEVRPIYNEAVAAILTPALASPCDASQNHPTGGNEAGADGSGRYPAELIWRVLQPNLVRVLRQKGLPQEDIDGVLRAARDSDRGKVSAFRLGKPVEESVLAFINYQEMVRDRLDLLPLVKESRHSVFP